MVTTQVKRGTIIDAIKVLGRVVSTNEADLSFRNSGRIRDVYVQPGDLVQQGQVLAELDQRDLPWQLAQARVGQQQAAIKLAQLQVKTIVDDTPVYQLAIQAAQTGVQQQQLFLERLQAGPQPDKLTQAQADVSSAQATLDQRKFDAATRRADLATAQAQLAQKQQGADPVLLLQARGDLAIATIKLQQAQQGARPEDVQAAQIALDQEQTKLDRMRNQPLVQPQDLENARNQVQQAQAALDRVLADINAGVIKGETARADAVLAAQLTLQAAQNTYTKLASTSVQPGDLQSQQESVKQAQLALDKLKNPSPYDAQTAQAAVTAAQTKLNDLLSSPHDSELTALKTQIDSATLAIDNADQAVKVALAALQSAQAKYDLLIAGPTDFDLRDAQNRLATARTNVDSANTQLKVRQDTIAQSRALTSFDVEQARRQVDQWALDVKNYEAQTGDVKVVAPFAGRITRLAARPGDTVQAFFPILNVSSLEGLEIKADIAEADLPRIAPGMPVDMTMDVFPNKTLTGRILSLPEQVVGQQGQAPDRATRITVDWPGPGAEMGMLARVQITLQIKPNVLMVPNGAVRTVGKRKFVEYMDGDIKRSRNVETGIVTDSDTEITSGVQEGMVILAGQGS